MDHQPENLLSNLPIIRIYTAFTSLILSIFAFYSDDLINSDGIMYLHMAQAFLDGGLSATQQIYDWPFFSILIAGFHTISSLPLELSAAIINSGLFVLLTDALLLISSRLVNNHTQLILAAILILSFYPINEYRDFIIRDIGYWAFCSLALYQFIKFIERPRLSSSSGWQVAILTAILFRIEGIVILLALPLYTFFIYRPIIAFKHTLHLFYLFILGFITVTTIFIGKSGLETAFGKLTSVSSYINFERVLNRLDKKSDILASQVLNQYSDEYSSMVLIAGLLFMLLFKVVKAFSFSYIALSIIGIWREKRLFINSIQPLLIYFITINILILTTFLFKRYFISSRYAVIALIGLFLVFLPIITQMMERIWLQKNKFLSAFIALLITASLIDSYNQSTSKTYIKDAAHWASNNLPVNSFILTDDQFLNYYFHTLSPRATLCVGPIYQKPKEIDYRGVTVKQQQECKPYIKQGYQAFDYLVVVIKPEHKRLRTFLATTNLELLFESKDNRENKAAVYKIIKVRK